ncbi:huntingtin [Echinococcus multilocularis]|uniref:Huntingtin n=1 Tax=Echinococcus multilocularis TaxID=6211 RepID=A0A068YNA4_ECHMU|nr:huntingtin [Echinococcus multilocularis]
MSYSSYEGRLLEVFSHFGMIQKDASEEGEDALISVILKIPKTRLLKDIGQLTEAYLAMQSLNPSNAVNYLSFVTGTLFELVSHPDPDVRTAADEGINQIVKFANIHLVQCVICEVFLEIKRSLHARSLSSALRKFSACIGQINPKKRRIYAVNILPALNGLINREEEMVWDCFAETIEPIAIFIFPHTSQQELITLLLRGLLERVECDKNYIRRSAATILASSVVHSRLPHELSYLLIQQLVGRVLVLKQRFLLRGSGGMVATAAVGLQGCLCTLRNLASLYSRIPTTALVNERTKSKGRPSPSTYLSASLIDLGVGIADFANWSRESLEFFWWSVVRLLCLQLACRKHQASSSSTMVCTAALECLLEILSSTPAGRPITELPEGFQEALGAFCSTTWPHSPSAVLHLDDYDSSVDASDADDVSSVTSHSAIPLTSTIVESEGEKVSLVKRNLLPPTSSTPAQRETEAPPSDLPLDAPDGPEFEDENEIVATSSLHSFLGLFAHRFGLLSGAQLTARAAAQSLAVACLAKLSLTLPPELFFEPLSEEEGEEKKAVTGIEMALHLMHHSDPQVRGNACLLVGNILHSTATYALIKPTSSLNMHQHLQIYRLISGLDDLLASERSGITYRMALKALRSCANTLLHLPAVTSTVDMETESASVRLLQCIASRLVDCARHPYRLVRRETLLLVAGLDWDQLEHLERAWFGRHRNRTSTRLVAATPLSIVAWNECLRLFADADRSLGREAFHSLLALAKRTPSADLQRTQMSGVDLESVDTVAAHLFEHSALTGQNAVACDLPVAQGNYTPIVSGFTDDLRCVTKNLPVYLRFSAPPSPSTQLKSSTTHRRRLWRHRHIRGLHRVFRELVDSFLELSPVCDSPENRSMMHSLIFGLAELLGRPPITSNHLLWYTPSPFPQPLDEGNENTGVSPARFALQHYQRRPKMALLLWHCISQLAISPLALTDLALQAQLLCLASGCALRWGVSSLLEGSVPAGGKMELHHDHAFTRASGALLKHVIKLLAMFWHVFKGVKPSSTASTTSTNIISNFVGGNLATSSVPFASASIGGASAGPSTIVTTTITTSQTKSKSIFGLQFVQTTETEEEENRLVLGSRETHGYFADSLEYMQLYNTIRASFEAFKSSFSEPSTEDLTMNLLAATLLAFSRLMEVLRFAEVVTWVEEVLCYLEAAFVWSPTLVLDAAVNLLRALFGTNLTSIWNPELADKFRSVLDPKTSTMTGADGLDVQIRHLCEAHFEIAEKFCSFNTIGRSFLDWLYAARQFNQPAMLRPSSLPSNIQQPNLAYYIRLFEPLVLQCLHEYHLRTDAAVQAKILHILTVLIELGVNYSQLDEEFRFLKTVMAQCESMQHDNATASYNHKTSSKEVTQLVSNMFQFFVALTHEKKISLGTTSDAKAVLSLSEVVHLVGVLAAGGVDVDSFVVPALAPLIIDVYVVRGVQYRSALRVKWQNSQQQRLIDLKDQLFKDLCDWNAHREHLLGFLMPKFIGHSRIFDFLCVILEDASLTDAVLKVPFDAGSDSTANKTATEICRHFLSALADCRLTIDTCGDVEAYLRLIKRLALPPWPTAVIHDFLLRQLIPILFHRPAQGFFFKESLEQSHRWIACKFVCLRFLLLLAIKQPSTLLPALREFGACGEADPRTVLFGHLLDLLETTCEALLAHLPDFVDEVISNSSSPSTGEAYPAFIGQLLLALELEILTFGRLHALSPSEIPQEKVERLDELLMIYGRLKPLPLILWHQIRIELFRNLSRNDLHTAPYHRNSVCFRRTVFLLNFRSKQDEPTDDLNFSPAADLLSLLKTSEVHGMIASVKDVEKRSVLLKEVLSTLITGVNDAKTPTEAVALLEDLKKLTQELSGLIAHKSDRKAVLLSLLLPIEKWFFPTSQYLIFKLPAIRREMELLLATCLREIDKSKMDEIPETLATFLASLDLPTTTFFTRKLPDALTDLRHRFSRAVNSEATASNREGHFVESLIEAVLQKSLRVSTKDAGLLAAKLLQLRRAKGGANLPEAVPPRLLQHIVRLGFVETMKRFNNDDVGTFGTDPLWQLGKELLFKRLSTFSERADGKESFLDSSQRQLAGIAAATTDFLLLSTRLPLPSACSKDEINSISAFLCYLMQNFIHLTSEIKFLRPCLLSLPLLTLRLSVVLSASSDSKDLDFGKLPLETFVQFAEALDVSASLSRPATLMDSHPSVEVNDDDTRLDHLISRLRCLLVPRQPGIFRFTTSAYTLTRFTEVLNSFAANAGTTSGVVGGVGASDKSRVALASVMGLCRLSPAGLRYAHALKMDSTDIAGQFSAFLIALCRRPEVMFRLRQPSAFTHLAMGDTATNDTGGGDGCDSYTNGHQWNPDRVIEMDRDALAEASSWFLSLGWLNRSMFESTWNALLAVCTPPPPPPSPSSSLDVEMEENPFVNSKEELVEINHCRVLGLNALTRLLLNAAHRPRPGDPLNSSPLHQPRLSLPPQFMHTRLGGRIGCVLSRLDQEARTWFYDIPSTNAVIGSDAGKSEECLSWLSTNLDLEHPADLDSVANQVPIECLVKWMLHSLSEPVGFEADTIFSCLQSLRLVHHAWLRPLEERLLNRARGLGEAGSTASTSSQRKKFVQFFKRNVRSSSSLDSTPHPPLAFGESILLTGVLSSGDKAFTESSTEVESVDESLLTVPEIVASSDQLVPSLSVLTAVVKSAVLCSDLFTTREQFLWLVGCLQAVYQNLPRIEEGFEAPIYIWLTTGLARCTAVLEATMLPGTEFGAIPPTASSTEAEEGTDGAATAAPQQHHSAPILLTANLQAAVSVATAAMGSTAAVPLQDAGLRAAMDLLQAALLLRATRHPALQQPTLLANPPTGSLLLNSLLIQVCLYLDSRLDNLFESEATLEKRWSTTKDSGFASLRIAGSGGSSGVAKITAGLVRTASTSGRGVNSALNRAADIPFKPRPPTEWAAECTASHQCTVLATAFYIVEQFSPLVTNESTALSRLIPRLINHLVRLANAMLRDTSPVFTPPMRLAEVFKNHFADTQATLVCADSVVVAWTRGMQRLLLSGTLRREECEMLAKQAAERLSCANSMRLRLLALSLLTTNLYVLNADFLLRASPDRSVSANGDGGIKSSLDQPSTDVLLSTSTEYLTSLWQCLRGLGSPTNRPPPIGSHTSPLEARCISLSLSSFLEDLGRCLLAAASSPSPSFSTILGGLVNKAVAEVARTDQAYVRLATAVLRAAVVTVCGVQRGAKVARELVLLTLPSILHQTSPRALRCHSYWVAAVCTLLLECGTELNCETIHSILAISLAHLPSPEWFQWEERDEEKQCLDLLRAASFLLPPSSSSSTEDGGFRDHFLDILRTAAAAPNSLEPCATADGLAGICEAMKKI